MSKNNLLVELFVEELPPKALRKLGDAFASQLVAGLIGSGLVERDTPFTAFASPRRLAVHVPHVAAKADDRAQTLKLMPKSVGLDASGEPTAALLKRLQGMGLGVDAVPQLTKQMDGKAEALYLARTVPGVDLAEGLQLALDEALAKLPIPKVMAYQLHDNCELPGWTSVNFVRPAHRLLALHGKDIVPVSALGLTAGRDTVGHRFESRQALISLECADDYESQLTAVGAVIPSFEKRRALIVAQLAAKAKTLATPETGPLSPIDDEALLDEVTALVERPNVVACAFESEFLEVPQECLILTMKANQKYFPLLKQDGKLSNHFLVVSNISPDDESQVIGGNERVVRPRLADAQFFFNQDRKKTLTARLPDLDKVVYHNKLGTQGERALRVRALAKRIAAALIDAGYAQGTLVAAADQAASLAKTDLVTDMVGEFPELQGVMGGYYARHDGLGDAIAIGIEDHYRPRFAGDDLPRNDVAIVVALADKLETLIGMFGIGNLPTGDRDPFALRRHALGVVRMLIERDLPLSLDTVLADGASVFGDLITHDLAPLASFIQDRLAGMLREQGFDVRTIDAVLALSPQRLADVQRRLKAVTAFVALPESEALAAANKRISNILKKANASEIPSKVEPALFSETAESALAEAIAGAKKIAESHYDGGDYAASLTALASLRAPVDAFFDGVMVNADDTKVRANRLALLSELHGTMNRVADLSRLASA